MSYKVGYEVPRDFMDQPHEPFSRTTPGGGSGQPGSAEREERTLYSLAQIQHLMRVEFNRAHRYRYPVACMLIGIDRLGHARDVYGYEVKERIVEMVVGMLMEATRTSDFLGRTADDRLMAVIPHTPPEGAKMLAERLVAGAAETPLEVDGEKVPISISVGLSHSHSGETMYFDSLLQAAEGAMSQAVEEGGGRWIERAPGGS
jgi:diguanylate cyclase (GGDEF)-like protein